MTYVGGVKGTQILVFGGRGISCNYNDVWVYEIKTNLWSKLSVKGKPSGPNQDVGSLKRHSGAYSSGPSPRYGVGAFVIDKKFAIFGGYDGKNVKNDVWVLDLGKESLEV